MEPRELRAKASTIVQAALKAVDPAAAMRRALSLRGNLLKIADLELDLSAYGRVVAVGAGKAGAPMAAALEGILGDRLSEGRVVVKDGHLAPTQRIEVEEANHPVPDQRGVAAGGRIAALLRQNASPDTLFFALLSGGGSALLVSPAAGITLADKQETTRLLLAAGADIGEINAIRKHLSQLKGGNLARLASPGRLITLIISDVVGDRLDVIASGPTVADTSTWQECADILRRYQLWDRVPAPVRQRVEQGLAGDLPETPKQGEPWLQEVSNYVISSNRLALTAAADEARAQGFTPLILSSTIEGETKDIARMHAAIAREVLASGQPLEPPCCLISGGETTVTLGEHFGQGGRNMEFALSAARDLAGLEGVLALSLGTDGTDGPTDAAGALADGQSVARAEAAGLSPAAALEGHDAYPFFAALNDLIITGPTLTNVMDVRLLLCAG